MFRVCHVFLSVHCSLVVTCWERADLLALMFVTFYCVFVVFPCGIFGRVWCLIVSIPDLCLLCYFVHVTKQSTLFNSNFILCYTKHVKHEAPVHTNTDILFVMYLKSTDDAKHFTCCRFVMTVCSVLIFLLLFKKISLRDTIRLSNRLDPSQARSRSKLFAKNISRGQ